MSKIYRRSTLITKGKQKKDKNRKRNIIVNFRVTQHEKELIEHRISLTGLTKSEYFIQSSLYQKILVKGNIKTFDKIKDSVEKIYKILSMEHGIEKLTSENIEELRLIAEILDGIYGKKGA